LGVGLDPFRVRVFEGSQRFIAGWSSPVARQAHNLKVIGSNPIPATKLVENPRNLNRLRGFYFSSRLRTKRRQIAPLSPSTQVCDEIQQREAKVVLGGIDVTNCGGVVVTAQPEGGDFRFAVDEFGAVKVYQRIFILSPGNESVGR
jgi:hypothetical protein